MARGQQTHKRHVLHINSATLLQRDECLLPPEQEEKEREEVECFGFMGACVVVPWPSTKVYLPFYHFVHKVEYFLAPGPQVFRLNPVL